MIVELSSHADMYTLALLNLPSPDSRPGLLSPLPSQDSDQFTRLHCCIPSLHHRGAPDRLFQSHGCKCICTLNCAVFFFFFCEAASLLLQYVRPFTFYRHFALRQVYSRGNRSPSACKFDLTLLTRRVIQSQTRTE